MKFFKVDDRTYINVQLIAKIESEGHNDNSSRQKSKLIMQDGTVYTMLGDEGEDADAALEDVISKLRRFSVSI